MILGFRGEHSGTGASYSPGWPAYPRRLPHVQYLEAMATSKPLRR